MKQVPEIGSFRDLNWVSGTSDAADNPEPIARALAGAAYFGSGRAALRRLLLHLRAKGALTGIVYVPTYYCPDVPAAVSNLGFAVREYPHTPFAPANLPPSALCRGDAIVNANLFGVFDSSFTARSVEAGAEVLEDHTHDPLSDAALRPGSHYVFSSLRKTIPIPDGGLVLRSPFPGPKPSEFSSRRSSETDPREISTSAMALKGQYLRGDSRVDKEQFLRMFADSEQLLGRPPYLDLSMSITGHRLLTLAPLAAWRAAHAANGKNLRAMLKGYGLQVLTPTTGTGFGAFVDFDNPYLAAHVQRAMVAADIYPARLWRVRPTAMNASAAALSERSLFFHADERYNYADMARVATRVSEALSAFRKE